MTLDNSEFTERLIEMFGSASLLPPSLRGPLSSRRRTRRRS